MTATKVAAGKSRSRDKGSPILTPTLITNGSNSAAAMVVCYAAKKDNGGIPTATLFKTSHNATLNGTLSGNAATHGVHSNSQTFTPKGNGGSSWARR